MPTYSNNKQNLWKSRIEQYRTSGLSAKEWCNENQVSIHAMKYWITKLNKNSNDESKSLPPVFVAVPSKPDTYSKSTILINLGDISVEISDGCNLDLLSDLMGILKNYA